MKHCKANYAKLTYKTKNGKKKTKHCERMAKTRNKKRKKMQIKKQKRYI